MPLSKLYDEALVYASELHRTQVRKGSGTPYIAHLLSVSSRVLAAVQDHGGHAVAFSRMDGAFLGSMDIAEKKARTSVFFRMETQHVWEVAKPGAVAPAIELTNGGLVMFAGGIPLYGIDNDMMGAIGVSGGTVDQDYEIAKAGVAWLTKESDQ